MQVRQARQSDMASITAIYRASVLNEASSFEVDPPDEAEITQRWQALVADEYPYLVGVTDDEAILGYCYASAYRPRPAYAASVECSVYVHENARRQGVARTLLTALIDACKTRGAAQMIAMIGDSQNTGSIALHKSLGFRHVGTLEGVGRKFDRWVDVVLMQCAL